jgi:hypothetical protein
MKRINEHPIDRLSRELLKDFSVDAPEGAFFAIKDDLRLQSKQRRKQYFFYIAASWLVLLSFGLGYWTRSIHINDADLRIAEANITMKTNIVQRNAIQIAQKTHLAKPLNHLVNISSNQLTVKSLKARSKFVLVTDNQDNTSSEDETTTNAAIQGSVQNGNVIVSKDSLLITNNKILSHIDSLKLFYKYISFTGGESIVDSSFIQNEILASNEPKLLFESGSKSNWTVVGGVAPMMGFDMFGTGQQNLNESRLKSGIVNEPDPTISKSLTVSFATGLSVKRSLGDDWNIRTGLNYNKITESNIDVSYVEIPVISEYKIVNKQLKIYFTNGIGAGIKQSELYPLGMTGFSFLYPLNKLVDFTLEPSYKHVFGKDWTYKADFYGMMAGFSVKF